MDDSRPSVTALVTAYARAYHAAHDTPKIFDDFLAERLFTAEEQSFFAHNVAQSLAFLDPERAQACPDQETALAWVMKLQNGPVTLSRSRYAEDLLEEAIRQGVRQYVILGAGLDTFAFRRPDLRERLTVFEVDHPATQAFKRQRLAKLGWTVPANLHFVPVDFTKEGLAAALGRSAYDPRQSTFFSWLGVTFYLTPGEVFATLRSLAELSCPGSTVVFDYLDRAAFDPKKVTERARRQAQIVRNAGEPFKSSFDPLTLPDDLAAVGLRLVENLNPADIEERYFADRTDGYHAFDHTHFARAVVE